MGVFREMFILFRRFSLEFQGLGSVTMHGCEGLRPLLAEAVAGIQAYGVDARGKALRTGQTPGGVADGVL